MQLTRLFWPVAVFMFFWLAACNTDQLPEPEPADCPGPVPTYTNDIQPIIDRSCAYSGCHLDDAPGNFTDYAGLEAVLNSGLFRTRVIDLRNDATEGMPPDSAPDDRPQNLTANELELIECWLAGGFPE